MSEQTRRTRIEIEAMVVGYSMSRLGARALAARGHCTWRQAYEEAAAALGLPPTSIKNLRDEFDPVNLNPRRGWRNRPLRPSRQRVFDELHGVSDDALLELVARILDRDEEATAEAIDSLAVVTRTAQNVAERLLTGRRAEEYFLAHSGELVNVDRGDILDLRQDAGGFDFGVRARPEWAIEVKGIKKTRGDIQFTDREWAEASRRGTDYWLVVVGNMASDPIARVIPGPHDVLVAQCRYQTCIAATWRANVTVVNEVC